MNGERRARRLAEAEEAVALGMALREKTNAEKARLAF
jgi:hypothetical protein